MGQPGGGGVFSVSLLALALFLDGNVLPILSLIPYPVLAVLVVFVGVQHSLLLRDLGSKREIVVATVIGIVGLATANLAIGVASGMCVQLMLTSLSRSHFLWSHPLRVTKGALKSSSGNIDT